MNANTNTPQQAGSTPPGETNHTLSLAKHRGVHVVHHGMRLLFSALARFRKTTRLRTFATLVFLLHPWCIVGVRAVAKLLHAQPLLIAVSPVFYTCVCLATAATALAAMRVMRPVGRIFHSISSIVISKSAKQNAAKGQRVWAQRNPAALLHNLAQLRGSLPPGGQIMAVVKANAYGHGAVWAAKLLQKNGVRAFAVATLEEGAQLRRHGIRGLILVLGYTHPAAAGKLWFYRLTQTAVDAAHAQALAAAPPSLNVHLKVDTGMHRLGIPAQNTAAIAACYHLPGLRVTGLFTHLARASSSMPEDKAFTQTQISRYTHLLEQLAQQGIHPGKTHLQSSYGLVNHPPLPCHYARVGLALFGVPESPAAPYPTTLSLKPVLSLSAIIASIRNIHGGEWVGYGRGHHCAKPTRVATIAIGYADGLPRHLTGGYVLIHGEKAPILGSICMDQLCADVTQIPHVAQGDTATIIGQNGAAHATAQELAARCGSITNELLCRLGRRVTYRG